MGLVERPSVRLLKHIIRCYLRLADNPRAKDALSKCLPDELRENTFNNSLKDDPTTKKWLSNLLAAVTSRNPNPAAAAAAANPAQIVS